MSSQISKINFDIDNSSIELIEKSFKRIATELINEVEINFYGNIYQIMDLEFYYYNFGIHQDCNIHFNERQADSNQWYLHKNSLNLGNKRKGIDLTFGKNVNSDNKIYGGILIKKVQKIFPNKLLTQSMFINSLIKKFKTHHKEHTFDLFKESIDNELKLEKKSEISNFKIKNKVRARLSKPCYKNSNYSFYIDNIL